jgi:hypothetical protein
MKTLKPKSRRAGKWIRAARNALLLQLGNRCACCGSSEDLTFDHINRESRQWTAADLSPYVRLLHYALDAACGEIQILCADCNAKKDGQRRRQLEFSL